MDNELMKKFDEGLSDVKRIADSLVKLVNEPLIEITPSPPQCPHCGRINPQVQLDQATGTGAISEFILEATCANCGKPLYAIAREWVIAGSRSEMIGIGEQMKNQREGVNQ